MTMTDRHSSSPRQVMSCSAHTRDHRLRQNPQCRGSPRRRAVGCLAFAASHASIRPLPAPLQRELTGPFWHESCPVSFSQLRVLSVRYWAFDGRARVGQLLVNADVASSLARVFRKLYELR